MADPQQTTQESAPVCLTGKAFGDMSGSEKLTFIGKATIMLLTGGETHWIHTQLDPSALRGLNEGWQGVFRRTAPLGGFEFTLVLEDADEALTVPKISAQWSSPSRRRRL